MTTNTRLNDNPGKTQMPLNSTAAALGIRRERFVQEYLADPRRNATAAYQRAGYRATGGGARAAAARLLRHPEVRKTIAESREVDAARYEVQRHRVIEELAKIAFFDPRTLFHRDGRMKLFGELSGAEAAALAHFQVEELWLGPEASGVPVSGGADESDGSAQPVIFRRRYKITLASKLAALESIVKVMGYAKDSGDTSAANPLQEMLNELRDRQNALMPIDEGDYDDEDD